MEDIIPQAYNDAEYKERVKEKVLALKKERDAVIVAHNYQREEIQDVADILGDSLVLAREVTKTKNPVVVFCGVHFMAESASILNPEKMILLPVKEAGCSLADMVSVEKLREIKKQHPGAIVVSYINSSAEIKAESDVCCTSGNAVKVVKSLKEKKIIFVPDRNLGSYVQEQVPEKEIIIWPGFCINHIVVSEAEVLRAKALYPKADVLVHPECEPVVRKYADHIASTMGMVKYVEKSTKKEFIITTEMGMVYALKQKFPDRKFYLPSEHLVCAYMKLTTLGWLLHSLKYLKYEVKVGEEIRKKAKRALDRMLEIA